MSLINQEGFYHGVIVGGGLNQSTNGFPQEVLALRADEVYDPDTDSYLPWDADNAEITAYLILIDSKDRETRNAKQLKKVTGWDGAAYWGVPGCLNEMDFTDMPIAFRVEENTYKENTTLQVSWVDTIDAPPFKTTVQPLTEEEGRALQSRYASVLASTKTPVKPVSAATAKAAKKTTKATAPKTPAAPKAPKPPKTTVGKCTVDEAYMACFKLSGCEGDKGDVKKLNDLWLVEVAKVNVDEAKITEEQWYEIKETMLKQVSKV